MMRISWVMILVLGFLFSSTYSFQKTRSHNEEILVGSVVRRAAKVAIEDYNREMNTELEFLSIEKAAGDFSHHSTYYLLLKVKDHNQRHKLFQTAVWCIPSINFYTSIGLEYIGEAEAEAETGALHYPPEPLLLKPGDWSMAKFAVRNHNRKMNSDLRLEQVVDLRDYWSLSDEYYSYYFTLIVYDRSQDKTILVETKVVKHKLKQEFYESTGLVYVSDLDPHTHLFPPTLALAPPPLIDEDTKTMAEFAVESHNVKMGTRLEFVDQLGMDYDQMGYDYKYQLTIQVIDHLDQGKNKIFKTVVVEKDSATLESTEFEFVSYTQPRPMAEKCQPYDLLAWVSPTILSKANDKFTQALVDQHTQNTTRHLSTIAHHLRSGRINLKSIPFLCEASYNLTDYNSMLSMITELEEFVPFLDGASTSHTVLIPLLTTLAKFEDPIVRETAVTLLSRVGEHMNEKDVLFWFVPHVKALATGESYAGRVSSTGLLHIAYLRGTTELKAELRLLYGELRRDRMLVVRRAAASNFATIAATDEVDVWGGARTGQTWAIAQGLVQNIFYKFPAFFNQKILPCKESLK